MAWSHDTSWMFPIGVRKRPHVNPASARYRPSLGRRFVLEYVALLLLIFVALVIFYGIIAINEQLVMVHDGNPPTIVFLLWFQNTVNNGCP